MKRKQILFLKEEDPMKKHVSGLLLFFCLTMFCLIGLFWLTDSEEKEEVQQVQAIEMYEPPLFAEN